MTTCNESNDKLWQAKRLEDVEGRKWKLPKQSEEEVSIWENKFVALLFKTLLSYEST